MTRSDGSDGLDCDAAGCRISEKANLGLPAERGGEPIHDFGHDKARDEQRTVIGPQQFPTRRIGLRQRSARSCSARHTCCDRAPSGFAREVTPPDYRAPTVDR
jgi:hypothetical protein